MSKKQGKPLGVYCAGVSTMRDVTKHDISANELKKQSKVYDFVLNNHELKFLRR